MIIKKFKGEQLLKVQQYLLDSDLLYKDKDGNYFLRGILIPNINQVQGITEPNEAIDWGEINELTNSRGTYDENKDLFTTIGLNTMYAIDLERHGLSKKIDGLLLIAYLIYEGNRANILEVL